MSNTCTGHFLTSSSAWSPLISSLRITCRVVHGASELWDCTAVTCPFLSKRRTSVCASHFTCRPLLPKSFSAPKSTNATTHLPSNGLVVGRESLRDVLGYSQRKAAETAHFRKQRMSYAVATDNTLLSKREKRGKKTPEEIRHDFAHERKERNPKTRQAWAPVRITVRILSAFATKRHYNLFLRIE